MRMPLRARGMWILFRSRHELAKIRSSDRVPVRVKIYSGLPHAFWIFPDISATAAAEDDLLEGIKWLIN